MNKNGQTLAEYAIGMLLLAALVIAALALLSPARPSLGEISIPVSGEIGSVDSIADLKKLIPQMEVDIAASLRLDQIDFEAGHGKSKHKEDAEKIQKCLNAASKNGTLKAFRRPGTERYIFPCEIEPGVWGVQVVDRKSDGSFDAVTAFVKQVVQSWDDMLAYLSTSNTISVPLP